MITTNNGPSSDAWGTDLTDPVLLTHQGLLILFARAKGAAVGSLYFRVLDPAAASAGDDLAAWNGWYRHAFPETLASTLPQNSEAAAALPARELRLAGMDLLTVTPLAEPVSAADAAFRVSSDGSFISVLRQSATGTLLLTRLGLLRRSETVDGQRAERFALEPAWEVRFRRSGLRDVPLDEVDSPSYLDPTGSPFYEPTIEFANIQPLAAGGWDGVSVPTANPEITMLYCAVAGPDGVQLHQVRRSSAALTDFTETPLRYPLLSPSLRDGGQPLRPLAGMAPALAFYAEQEAAGGAQAEGAELQRAGHLMLAIPVGGAGLDAALAIYDFALDSTGNIAVPDAHYQSLVLVDGTLSGGVFTPDTSAPAFPKPADLPATVQMVDGLLVSSMLLGQIQPKRSPLLYFGDDGLLHVYYGGPPPVPPFDRWSSLDPALPQALVAQFDARANRLTLKAPWVMSEAEEQGNGQVEFLALQSGCLMQGTTLRIGDARWGGVAAPELCDLSISYPAATGLPTETWLALPRELGAFMAVLNGQASDDSADPQVLSGSKPFYDFAGQLPQARLPLSLPVGVSSGPAPVLTLVSTRPDIGLASVSVSSSGDALDFSLVFSASGPASINLHWRGVPAQPAVFGDVFDGTADPRTYIYPADTADTALFALQTDAAGVPAPVLLYALGSGPALDALTISVTAGPPGSDSCHLLFVNGTDRLPISDVPTKVADFINTLQANASFRALGLGLSGATAGGRVLPTPSPVVRMGLAATVVLFDVLLPAIDLSIAQLPAGNWAAGLQGHQLSAAGRWGTRQMAGLLCRSLRPSAGATALVQNTPQALAAASRTLHAHEGSTPLVSGVWVRAPAQWQCAFTTTDSASVPVASQGAVLPVSANLRPQWDWTLETWIRPSSGEHQRLLSFADTLTPVPAGAPALAYALALESQQVVTGSSYAKVPGMPDASYFQTGTSQGADFMPTGEFTWEFWLKPQEQAAPPAANGSMPVGGVLQLGQAGRTPFLVMGLSADRHVLLVTLDENGNSHVYQSTEIVPAVDEDGQPTWSHLALIGVQDRTSQLWRLQLMLDADSASSFTSVQLQMQSGAFLVIGADTPDNATLYGSMAQLRYWSIARSEADIRRTWLSSMSGREPGLLGNWPLSAIETGGATGQFVRNTAALTGSDWDAPLFSAKQPVGTSDDAFFLSVVASVGGLPAVEADTLLANGRWNHLALVYQAGGALEMNPGQRYQAGCYDWVDAGPAEALGPSSRFAIDAFVRVPSGSTEEVGTLMARWADDANPSNQSFMYWIDKAGEMNLSLALLVDQMGTVGLRTAQSTGAKLIDGQTHHLAVSFGWTLGSGDKPSATWQITFYKDGVVVGSAQETLADLASITLQSSQAHLSIGAAYAPVAGAAPRPAEDFHYLRATLGELRFWVTDAGPQALFPENYPRNPQSGQPKGLAARWSWREQAGRNAFDLVSGNDATLSNSAMWASLAATSRLSFIANGAAVGHVAPAAATVLPALTQSQFTLGQPLGGAGVAGFKGDMAQLALYDEARSLEMIQDQMYVPKQGDESALIACWNFSDAGVDITGGQNNCVPPLPNSRLSASSAPLSNEGPYVRNIYGGRSTDLSQSTPGRMAVGSYADAQNVGTPRQRAVLKRQYLFDPDQSPSRAIQIGELELSYVGQVQSEPALIGYIEGAPPVPSENLTRPYYLEPGNPSYMKYMDTAKVTLLQEAASSLTFSSSSSHATQIEAGAAIGLLGIQNITNLDIGVPPFSVVTDSLEARGIAQAIVKGFGAIGGGDGQSLQANWSATQRDTMGVNGDWEDFQSDPKRYFNPVVGRRFVVDNAGYALVESLSADLYAITFGPTKASLGSLILPNPAIPPDRNIIVFPMHGKYTKNGTLDGKVGLLNDSDWLDADIQRGSYFQPAQAYALAASIEQQRQRSESRARQFDPERQAHGWDTSLNSVQAVASQDFSSTPADPVALATPVQGLVNRYVWTADGGFHAEEQRTGATSTRSYMGNVARGGGGGFHADGEYFLKVGLAWSFDIMATHRVDVQVSKESSSQQTLSLEVLVEGDAFLRAFDPLAPADYGGGQGAYRPGAAPGKVKTYRFMTFYLPPSTSNSAHFQSIVDPVWLRLSNDANARALRQLDASSATWRVLHRVTYVERIPPAVASRPLFTPAHRVVEPVNVEGNAELVRLINAQIPPGTTERSRLIVGNAVAATLNPAPTAPGVYPPSALEAIVPWWLSFLQRARPGAQGTVPDAQAAAELLALVGRTTQYLVDGYATQAFEDILKTR
jgi:hypothetical protein